MSAESPKVWPLSNRNHPARKRARRQQRIAAGVCTRCGQRPPPEGRRLCDPCATYASEDRAKRRAQDPEGDREKHRVWLAGSRRAARATVMQMYGGRCACCGETQIEFLTIDHINGNGIEHRASLGISKSNHSSFYAKLAQEPKRDDLMILCANCHMAKDLFGGCPHQLNSK
jgi:hypothetical protein